MKYVWFHAPYGAYVNGMRLPEPIFGDSLDINLQTQLRHSRNGDVYMYKRTPTYQTMKLSFENIRARDVDAAFDYNSEIQGYRLCVMDFIKKYAAVECTYIPHNYNNTNNLKWRGFITTPTISITNAGKGRILVNSTNSYIDEDWYNISFDFECKKVGE